MGRACKQGGFTMDTVPADGIPEALGKLIFFVHFCPLPAICRVAAGAMRLGAGAALGGGLQPPVMDMKRTTRGASIWVVKS